MQLRHAGLVESRRGADGGYRLARAADEVTLADVIRAIDGPLAAVSGTRPESLDFEGVAEPMRDVWIAVRASLRSVLEQITLADITAGELQPTSEPCSPTTRPGSRTRLDPTWPRARICPQQGVQEHVVVAAVVEERAANRPV